MTVLQFKTKPPRARAKSKPPSPASAKWQGDDPVFFHRTQIQIGTTLTNFGRLHHGQTWQVVEIRSFSQRPNGQWFYELVPQVTKLSDEIILRRTDSNEIRQIGFATLSYSAIWRLRTEGPKAPGRSRSND